jgi:hypothetical protein
MLFCPICSNTFDITKTNVQSGGNGNDSESELTWEDSSDKITTDSSTSSNYLQKGGVKNELTELFNNIITKKEVTYNDIKKYDLKEIVKKPEYKNFSSKNKEYIYNKFKELMPKNKNTKSKKYEDDNPAFFICSNCNFTKKINDGRIIYSKTYGITKKTSTINMTDMIYDDTLPRTRKYICPNTNCESHTNANIKEAVFYRDTDSYKINFICIACKSSF